jgi:hypothetical protein
MTTSRQLSKQLDFTTTFNGPATLSKSIDRIRGGLKCFEILVVRVYITGGARVNDDGR